MYTLTTKYVACAFYRLPQRSHLRTLKNFVSEKSGKRFEKSGKHWIKSENLEEVHFFPLSAPELHFARTEKTILNK